MNKLEEASNSIKLSSPKMKKKKNIQQSNIDSNESAINTEQKDDAVVQGAATNRQVGRMSLR